MPAPKLPPVTVWSVPPEMYTSATLFWPEPMPAEELPPVTVPMMPLRILMMDFPLFMPPPMPAPPTEPELVVLLPEAVSISPPSILMLDVPEP